MTRSPAGDFTRIRLLMLHVLEHCALDLDGLQRLKEANDSLNRLEPVIPIAYPEKDNPHALPLAPSR